MTSPDGITWTGQMAAEANPWVGLSYGNGLFVAVSYSGTNQVMTSPDGVTWTPVSVIGNQWRSVTYGNGQFVAVAASGGVRIMTSADGTNWTTHIAPAAAEWDAVEYGLGRFVAVDRSGVGQMMTSTNGISWTLQTTEASNWESVAFGNGRFVAVASGGTSRMGRASCECMNPINRAGTLIFNADHRVVQWCDGAHWHAAGPVDPPGPNAGCGNPAQPGGFLMFNGGLCLLQYCDGDNWRGIGKADPCACEPNAGTWTAQTMPESQLWRGAAYGNGVFVAVAANPASSPDGVTWTVHNTVPLWAASAGAVAFGNGLFVAPSSGAWTRRVTTSPDGINWTAHDSALPPSWPSSGQVSAITYGGGQFVAAGGGGSIATSPDGTSWTARTSGVTTDFTGIAYGNGLYVAVGTWFVNPTHPVAVSPDGINWTAVPAASVFNAKWTRIAFGEGLFVARSYQGGPNIMYSSDGVNWTAGDPGNVASSDGPQIIYADGRFVAAGLWGSGLIYQSDDGITWSVLASGVPHDGQAIAYGDGIFVTVADGTGAMRATCVH